ncbi:MAG TPA: hypothetical protein VGS27_13095 [Candidatus Sulfotelmatobacter sp.]|nr:hypothetical protein [Candidatus Sulfotelmatobacter sp.]
MIGLDTNILIRYLTQDDPLQAAQATEIFERRLTARNPGFISVVAMVETVCVLDRAYGLSVQEIATPSNDCSKLRFSRSKASRKSLLR